MKKIYIILTHTGTTLSKLIKSYTKNEFSHVSISLDNKLEKMYSFGRLHPYNPFWAGFVHEGIDFGTFKRFYLTKAKIYSLEVTEEQYEKMEKTIEYMNTRKKLYKFNIIGLFAVSINKKVKFKNSFYCAEFVKYVLEEAGVKTNLPEIIKPEDFKNLESAKLVYNGKLNEYKLVPNF